MRATLLALVAVVALGVSTATAAPPPKGVLVPGSSLGGVRLGMGKAQVKMAWGSRFGRCKSCLQETWYFTYERFAPEGAAVAFDKGKAVRVYTLWQPEGWRTSDGLELGTPVADVDRALGYSGRVACGDYDAVVRERGRVSTAYYLDGDELWGFGLMPRGSSPCVDLAALPRRTAWRRAG